MFLQVSAQMGSAASRQDLRIAIVGCGEVTEHKHLPALGRVRGARVVAVADVNPARCRHVAERYHIPHQFPDVAALLDARVADVVGALVPPGAHADVALQALDAGCHVLVEKPLALTLDDADALIAKAHGRPLRAAMGFHMRWHRLVRRAREVVQSGQLGAIESIQTVWNSPRPDKGIPAWKCTRATGGGALVELGVHLFDLWRFLLGANVVEVFARTHDAIREDEHALVTARLDNGVLATAVTSERTSHDIDIEIAGAAGRMRVACQRFDGLEIFGVKETSGMMGPRLRALVQTARETPRGVARMRSLGDYGDSYRGMWQHLVDAIAGGTGVDCTLDDGRKALEVVLAAAGSADTGLPVAIAKVPRTLSRETAAG
jgi:myo-inositol 2-dehydrogenase / D-chiro-inositol 1-dehydrogenase